MKADGNSISRCLPEKLDYLGLNTFTPSRHPKLHQRGYQVSAQHHYVANREAYSTHNWLTRSSTQTCSPTAEILPPASRNNRSDFLIGKIATQIAWSAGNLQSTTKHFYGEHQLKAGFDFSHSSYDGHQQFLRSTSLCGGLDA